MKICEILCEASQKSLYQENDGGTLEGYVVPSSAPNIRNYLQSQGATNEIIDQIVSNYATIGLIRNMYVNDDMRGQGFGNELVSNAIDAAADHGADAIILVADLSESNVINLQQWYEGFGFETVGVAGGDPVMLLDLY